MAILGPNSAPRAPGTPPSAPSYLPLHSGTGWTHFDGNSVIKAISSVLILPNNRPNTIPIQALGPPWLASRAAPRSPGPHGSPPGTIGKVVPAATKNSSGGAPG